MDAIVIEKLTKTHKPTWPWQQPATVLSDVSISVGRGEIFGFLGPNGAGKTTTMKILLGLMRATSGSVELLGAPANDVNVHKHIGYLPESPYFYDYLSAEEFLVFYGRLAGLNKVDLQRRVPLLLSRVGLIDAQNRPLRKFSKGMLQRIGLAQALIHDPELVILDEPMSGLDPIGRKQVRDLILGLRDQGKTVFFSTHIIPDVELICDRVGIVIKGRLVAAGRVDELVSHAATRSIEIVCEGIPVENTPGITRVAGRVYQRGRQSLILLEDPQKLEDVLAAIHARGQP